MHQMQRLLLQKRPRRLTMPTPFCPKYYLKAHAFNVLRVRRVGCAAPNYLEGGWHGNARNDASQV